MPSAIQKAITASRFCFDFDFSTIKDPHVIEALKRLRGLLNNRLPDLLENYNNEVNNPSFAGGPGPIPDGDKIWTDRMADPPAKAIPNGKGGMNVIAHINKFAVDADKLAVVGKSGDSGTGPANGEYVCDLLMDPVYHILLVRKGTPAGGGGYGVPTAVNFGRLISGSGGVYVCAPMKDDGSYDTVATISVTDKGNGFPKSDADLGAGNGDAYVIIKRGANWYFVSIYSRMKDVP